jgi:hypothetical protein
MAIQRKWVIIDTFLPTAGKCFKRLLDSCQALSKVSESCWEMPKGYWRAYGQFLKGIGKPLGNAQIPAVSQ